jgi:CDP-diacylglycerol--glycerol-3-phosphate 3-phosphatidyltransferase
MTDTGISPPRVPAAALPAIGAWRHVPNLITVSRLSLSVAFFVMLANARTEIETGPSIYLHVATIVYLVAALTDWLDGYLARRWNATSVFGRVVDPFVDKVLVLGAFAYFAGPSFSKIEAGQIVTLTGVSPTVVLVLLAREFLVTTLRGVAEGSGANYGAAWSGKVKMVVQCVTIFVVLAYVNYRPELIRMDYEPAARVFRDVCVWATLLITVVSSWTYLRRSLDLARGKI